MSARALAHLVLPGILALALAPTAPAAVGDLDSSFSATTNAHVYGLAVQKDGKILIGGHFTQVNGAGHKYLARLNPDGTTDPSFTTIPNADVNALALQPDGKIVIAGIFTEVSGVPRARIARLNPDGTIDSFFNGAGPDGQINAMVLQKDGKIVVGGWFNLVGTTTQGRIARLNPDGSLDASFAPVVGSTAGSNQIVDSLAIQPDGKVLAGGRFNQAAGTEHNNIVRITTTGSIDSFNPSLDKHAVSAIAVQKDGKILIGGAFTTVAGTSQENLARLNADGSLDRSFKPDVDDFVTAILPQADGKILIGGLFSRVNGTSRKRLARLNPDGTTDSGFAPTIDPRSDVIGNGIFNLTFQPDGKLLIAGLFTGVSGSGKGSVARLMGDRFTAATPKVTVTKKDVYLTTTTTFAGAGKFSQTAKAKTVVWCRVTKKIAQAGLQQIKCQLGKKARKYIRRKALKLTVETVFTPTGAAAISNKSSLTVPRTP